MSFNLKNNEFLFKKNESWMINVGLFKINVPLISFSIECIV